MNSINKAFDSLSFRRLAELVIYFVLATTGGHYLETVWKFFRYQIDSPSYILGQLSVPPLAEPYGLGVVGVILFAVPFIEKYKPSVVASYILNVLVTAIAEYISAVALVLAFGRNNYWNYSEMPFNIQGYVCLETSMLFGIAATLFVYLVYPACERWLKFQDRKQLITTTLVSVIFYTVCRVMLFMG